MKIIILVSAVLLLAACANPYTYPEAEDYVQASDTETYCGAITSRYVMPDEDSLPLSWQEAFAALLWDKYEGEHISDCGNLIGRHRFFLHDMNLDGTPVLFVLNFFAAFTTSNTLAEYTTVYTFSDGRVVPVGHGEDIGITHLLHGAARTQMGPTPENVTGFTFMVHGPGSEFGGSSIFWRAVMEDYNLVVADHGEWYIDIGSLRELFYNTLADTDQDIIYAAIQEHTHLSINGNPATKEELDRLFGLWDLDEFIFWLRNVDEANINDIWGWKP